MSGQAQEGVRCQASCNRGLLCATLCPPDAGGILFANVMSRPTEHARACEGSIWLVDRLTRRQPKDPNISRRSFSEMIYNANVGGTLFLMCAEIAWT
jgi:hypothetical protein